MHDGLDDSYFLTGALLAIKDWEKTNLPSTDSGLSHHIFLLIAHHSLSGTHLTLNQLYFSINYSVTGIRKQLFRLIKNEWCYLEASNVDKRVKFIVASEKMILLFERDDLKLKVQRLFHQSVDDQADVLSKDN
jgi:hypothetical protein